MRWRKGGEKEMASDFSDSPVLTCGWALLLLPHFKAKDSANINSGGAAAGAGRQPLAYQDPLHGKQWIKWRTGLWQRNREPGYSEKVFLLYVSVSALSIFTPWGKHTVFHSLCSERSESSGAPSVCSVKTGPRFRGPCRESFRAKFGFKTPFCPLPVPMAQVLAVEEVNKTRVSLCYCVH